MKDDAEAANDVYAQQVSKIKPSAIQQQVGDFSYDDCFLKMKGYSML